MPVSSPQSAAVNPELPLGWLCVTQHVHPPIQALKVFYCVPPCLYFMLAYLQVGYVSPDMFTHSVSYFAEAPLGAHRSSRVKLYVYSCVGKPDAKTARLQAKVGGWACRCMLG
jgi:hypothetical protein